MSPDHVTRAMQDIVRDFRRGNQNRVVTVKLCADGTFRAECYRGIGTGADAVSALGDLRAYLTALYRG